MHNNHRCHCKKWMVVLTIVNVTSVSFKLAVSLGTILFQLISTEILVCTD